MNTKMYHIEDIRGGGFEFSDRWKENPQFMDRYIEDDLELRICIILQTEPRNLFELTRDIIKDAL